MVFPGYWNLLIVSGDDALEEAPVANWTLLFMLLGIVYLMLPTKDYRA